MLRYFICIIETLSWLHVIEKFKPGWGTKRSANCRRWFCTGRTNAKLRLCLPLTPVSVSRMPKLCSH